MAATSTLKNIVDAVVKETGIGIVIPSFTGTTTTLTLTTTGSSELRGPFTGKKYPIGAPIVITAGGTPLEDTYVSDWNPTTGVITVSPAITTGSTDAVMLTHPEIPHGDRLVEAITRTFDNRAARWQRTPLTFVPDGDLRGGTVTDYWTGTAATPTYVTPTFPAASAAYVPAGGIQRVLQSVTTNATNSVKSNIIDVAKNSSITAYQWYFQTAIRVVSGSGNAQIYAYDETNAAAITANVITGDNQAHTTTSLGFINMSGTLNIPATCKQITFRLVSDSTTTTLQMTPLVAYPVDAVSFPIPARVISEEYIGNFRYAVPVSGTSGPYSITYSDPITTGGLTHRINNFGDHFTVTFNFRPTRPVYFDELASELDGSVSTMASTSSFPLNQVVKWAKFELWNFLWETETPKFIAYGTRSVPEPSKYLARRNAAYRSAAFSEFEPETIHVVGRV